MFQNLEIYFTLGLVYRYMIFVSSPSSYRFLFLMLPTPTPLLGHGRSLRHPGGLSREQILRAKGSCRIHSLFIYLRTHALSFLFEDFLLLAPLISLSLALPVRCFVYATGVHTDILADIHGNISSD